MDGVTESYSLFSISVKRLYKNAHQVPHRLRAYTLRVILKNEIEEKRCVRYVAKQSTGNKLRIIGPRLFVEVRISIRISLLQSAIIICHSTIIFC